MALILDLPTQDIYTDSGDGGSYAWADVVAAGSSLLTTHSDTNGMPLYRWRGILRLRDALLTIEEIALLELLGVSTTNPGQIIADNGGEIRIKKCGLQITHRFFSSGYSSLSYNGSGIVSVQDSQIKFAPSSLISGGTRRQDVRVRDIEDCLVASRLDDFFSNYVYVKSGGSVKGSIFLESNFEALGSGITLSDTKLLNNSSIVNWTGGRLTFRGLTVSGANNDYETNQSSSLDLIDCSINLSNGRITREGSSPPQESRLLVPRNIKLVSGGNPVVGALVSYSGRSNVSATSVSGGIVPELLLIIEETNLASMTFPGGEYSDYSKPIVVVDYSAYTLEIKSYLHESVVEAGSITSSLGTPTQPAEKPLILDEGVTQTNTTTVAAYSGISHGTSSFSLSGTLSLNQAYDSRKLYWRNNNSVSAPTKVGSVADFGVCDITISSPSANPGITSKYSRATHTGTLTLSAAGNYSSTPWDEPSTGIVEVVETTTDLSTWSFSGATVDNTSPNPAIVKVGVGQSANITATSTGGGSITIQEPVAEIRVFGLPTVASTILSIKNLTTNAITYHAVTGGEITLPVDVGANYEIKADAPGYLFRRVVLSGETPEFEMTLTSFRALYELGANRASQILFNHNTLVATINDNAATLNFADVFRTIEDYLVQESSGTYPGLSYTAQPYPVVLPDRQILRFPRDSQTNAINPFRIKPDPTNTIDPALLFEIDLEGADPYDLFDFSAAGGRIIRIRSVVAVAQVEGDGSFSPEDKTRLTALHATLQASGVFSSGALVNTPASFTTSDRARLNQTAIPSDLEVTVNPTPVTVNPTPVTVNAGFTSEYQSKLTTVSTQVQDLFDLQGHNPDVPMTANKATGEIIAGSKRQIVTEDGDVTTYQREDLP